MQTRRIGGEVRIQRAQIQRTAVQCIGVAAAAGLLLTGCSSSDSGSSGSTASKPTTPTDQLLPVQADFPTGATLQKITPDQLTKAADQAVEAMKSAKVDPAHCAGNQEDLAKAEKDAVQKSSVAAAVDMNAGKTYTTVIADSTPDLDKLKKASSGDCADITMKVASEGQPETDVKMHTTDVALPKDVNGSDAFAYKTVMSMTMPNGAPQSSTSYSGYADVRGLGVVTKVQSLSGDVDQAAFDKLFSTAVKKVQDAK